MSNRTTPKESAGTAKKDLAMRVLAESKGFAKAMIGKVAIKAFPERATRLESHLDEYSGGLLDKALKAGLFHRAGSTGAFHLLAQYHRRCWQSPKAKDYYDHSEQRFKEWFLKNHIILTDVLERYIDSSPLGFMRLYDIGCGSGFTTYYMAERFPHLTECIGIDLRPAQVSRDNQTAKNPRVRFEIGNAIDWIRSHGRPNAIYFTTGGVLEYFTPVEITSLLDHISIHLRPALLACIEPVWLRHDLVKDAKSKPYGPEMSFSHNYPSIFRQGGFQVEFVEELMVGGIRWLLMLASAV